MTKFLKVAILLLAFMATKNGIAQENKTDFNRAFTHVVYFWLNNPDSAEDRREFVTSLNKFMENSEYAETKFIGIPADTPRDVVDNSYTYSLILTFPSKEIQNKYQTEPAHLLFIEEASHLWRRVQVYDSVGLVD